LKIKSLLLNLTIFTALFFLISAFFASISIYLRKKRKISETVTWACGYNEITPRMQYTAHSFSKPVTDIFSAYLRPKRKEIAVKDLFPQSASIVSQANDIFYSLLLRPAFNITEK